MGDLDGKSPIDNNIAAAQKIENLVERFERNIDAYRAGKYNETLVRRDFIDPMFAALGWDIDNTAGYAEAYRDVIHEDAIKVGGATKAPDYCFRVGGTRKFFVEAKKPSVDIARDIHPAYQLRRYGWSAKLPLSILTDFEEFAVYDCRIRPKQGDKASTARTMYFTFDTYVAQWDKIASVFAKEAVLQGSFDKYVIGRKKRGTAEVDAEFLKEIEKWRAMLARNIALRNPALGVREINFAVQRTIDRVIFLRMCEDRGAESYGRLQGLMNGIDVYGRLMQMFRSADDRYNSGLFHFNDEPGRARAPDTLTPGLKIDDKILKDIFRGLYYPTSPYEFSVLPADILGNVYEQFLGSVIHLTKTHQARVEEKPEVKKAGGVYYTPKYIVDYIVAHTVGRLIGADVDAASSRVDQSGKDAASTIRRPKARSDPGPGRGAGESVAPFVDAASSRVIQSGEDAASTITGPKARSDPGPGRGAGESVAPFVDAASSRVIQSGEDAASTITGPKARSDPGPGRGAGESVAPFVDAASSRVIQSGEDAASTIAGPKARSELPESVSPGGAEDGSPGRQAGEQSAPQKRARKGRKKQPAPKTPKQIAKLRILDPACGSGSFLVGAYKYLLDYHRDWYFNDGPEKHTKEIYQGAGGQWYLTTAAKKRILLNNIHGVDIDSQAVEVTKLNLLLCVLENENQNTIGQMALIHERVLPDLSNNIKCGNSLIGSDFYQGQQLALFDTEAQYRINAFDWETEFPQAFKGKKPGFDAVIGNPPYIRMEEFKELKDYLKANYSCHADRSDLYAYFIEKEHRLLKDRGCFGMIVSNKFLRAKYGRALRSYLSRNSYIRRIVDFAGLPVFPSATVRTLILITSKESPKDDTVEYSPPLSLGDFEAVSGGSASVEAVCASSVYGIARSQFSEKAWTFPRPGVTELLHKCSKDALALGTYCDGQIWMGIKSGLTEAFVINAETRQNIIAGNPDAAEIIRPFVNGRDVRRYNLKLPDLYLIYTYHGVDISKYPGVVKYLEPHKNRLKGRATKQEWYELQQPQYRYSQYFEKPKLVFPDIATCPRFTLDETGVYGANTVYFIPKPDLYLLGLLNSKLGFFYFSTTCAGLEGKRETYLRFFGQYLEGFPIRQIDFTDASDKSRHDGMVELVERMLGLHKALPLAKTDHDKTLLQRQITTTDHQIDQLVYELYGLTDDEIGIVEGAGE